MGRIMESEVLENALQSIRIIKNSTLDEVVVMFLEELKEYREIGTVEEIIHSAALALVEQVKLEKYEAIGTVEECNIAVERMKVKKPEICADIYRGSELIGKDYRCSKCGMGVAEEYICCPYCGQHFDWTEEE